MTTIRLRKRVLTLFLAIIITIASLQSLVIAEAAEVTTAETVVTITAYEAAGTGGTTIYNDSYIRADDYGQYLWVTGKLTTKTGEALPNRSVKVYYTYIIDGAETTKYSSGSTDENGIFHARIGGRSYFTEGSTFTFYAEFKPSSTNDKNAYETSQSETTAFSVVKQEKPDVDTAPEHKSVGVDGVITVKDPTAGAAYEYAKENPTLSGKGNTQLYDFTDNTAVGLLKGEYYVRAAAYVAKGEGNNTLYLASDYTKAVIELTDYEEYTVTLNSNSNATWQGNGDDTTFKLKEEIGNKSVYIKPTDDKYIVDSVTVEPNDGADVVYYFNTGEVNVKNIKKDITLTPVVSEKKIPTNIHVDYKFLPSENSSEENPSVPVEFTVTVTDQNGNPAPAISVYYKQDDLGVSFDQIRATDTDGKAVFKNSYSLDELNPNEKSWNSVFALDSEFQSIVVEQDIKVVQQKAKDLVLYTNQLVGTDPNENNGKVINVPDNYQLWTGEIHQGAYIVTDGGAGEWISPTNGEFTGLSSGEHAIRAGVYMDYANNTIYLDSDYAVFVIPRGNYTVTVDTEKSKNVVFTGDTTQKTNPESTVYIYVKPEDGYKITSYEIDKPNKVSSVNYYDAEGYIAISGVYDSVVLTVKAEKIEVTVDDPHKEIEKDLPKNSDDDLFSNGDCSELKNQIFKKWQINRLHLVDTLVKVLRSL